jgi:predicted dehydrogenase
MMADTSRVLGVALLGCGEIGAVRASALARSPVARLVAACDADPARAAALAAKHRAACVAEWREAIARPDVDVVCVSTPTSLHAGMAVAAARAGKHVLVEKPLARSVAEAQEMVGAARAAGVVLKTGFNHRHYLAVEAARHAIAAGAIGEPMFVRTYIGHEGGSPFLAKWMARPDMAGGGTLLDNGIHILDLVRYFLGEVSEAEGLVTNSRWRRTGLEDNAFALFRSPDGKIAALASSWTEWAGYKFLIEVYGTEGFVRAAYPPMRATIGRARDGRPAAKTHRLFPMFQLRERLEGYWLPVRMTFVREFQDLADAVATGLPVFSSGDDGLRANQMVEAVYESSARGVRVAL